MRSRARKQCERCKQSLDTCSFSRLAPEDIDPEDSESGTCSICRSCEFVEEYEFLRTVGLGNHEIASKLGISMPGLMKRINQLDCIVMNTSQRFSWDLIVRWVERGQSFTALDFPGWVPDEDIIWATARAVRKGMIRRSGTVVTGLGSQHGRKRLFVPVDQKVLV